MLTSSSRLSEGVLLGLKELGLRHGRDVEVIGFDNFPWAALLDPPIPVIAQPTHQIGRRAVRMLTDMIVDVRAARLLCLRAGWLRESGDPGAFMETMAAKYFASRVAFRAANDAVQIHGANGCSDDYPVARYLRDAKVMEIIEGSTQIQQMTIPKFEFQEF